MRERLPCMAVCVKITWTRPRPHERCDLYIAVDPTNFNCSPSIHGWAKQTRCAHWDTATPPLVRSKTTKGWTVATGVCAALPAGTAGFPSGCVWWHRRDTNTKHFVRNCGTPDPGWECPVAAAECWSDHTGRDTMALLSRAVRVPNAEVAAISIGANFTCVMATGFRCQLPSGSFNLTTWVYDFGQNSASGAAHRIPYAVWRRLSSAVSHGSTVPSNRVRGWLAVHAL